MESVISFLSNHYPTIGICIAVAFIVYRVTMYHVSLQNTRKKVDELPCNKNYQILQNIVTKLDNLLCSAHEQRLDTQNKTIDENGKKLVALESKITSFPCNTHDRRLNDYGESISDMSVWIMKRDKAMIPVFINKKSPYYLNSTGLALLEDCGGKKCIDENINYFLSELESTNPETPYDVEERAIKTVMRSKGLPFFNPIKNYLYFKPDVVELGGNEVEISIFAVASVMGIYLRDIYLKKHPEILTEHSSVYA